MARNPLTRELNRKLLPVALAIGVIIALILPGIYVYLQYAQVKGDAETYARMLSLNIRKLVADSPDLWKYQATKYSSMIEMLLPHTDILHVIITDEQNAALRQYEHRVEPKKRRGEFLIYGESVPVVFNNRKIGEIRIGLSGYAVFLSGIIALLMCGVIGTSLAFVAHYVPLRVTAALEEDLLKYQASLEERVAERTVALQETTERALALSEEARRASEAKSQFLANMSHELRTPLNHIIGFTELLVDRNYGPINNQQEEFLGDVLQSSRHLLELINEILDLAKVEAGKMELQLAPVSLRPLVANSLVMLKEKALKHRIRLTAEMSGIPETFPADERKLKQILYNLLSNAVKFTPDGGSVCLRVAPERAFNPEAKAGLRFSIVDSGIGIAPQDLKRIFEPFEQADNSTSRKYEGTGLGLTLTRKLVALHDGLLWAESEGLGKGSRFHFTLSEEPGAVSRQEAAAMASTAPDEFSEKRGGERA